MRRSPPNSMNSHGQGVVSPVAPTPARDMEAAGIDIVPDRKNNLASKRAKKGQCPKCGTQTHKVARFGKNKPLTVEGQVFKGLCLQCNRLEGYIRRPTPAAPSSHSTPNSAPTTAPGSATPGVQGMPPLQSGAPRGIHPGHAPLSPQPPQPHHPPLPYDHAPTTQQPTQQYQQQQYRPHYRPPSQSHVNPTSPIVPANQPYSHTPQAPQYHPPGESRICVPHTLEVGEEDDVSVITMDFRLAQGARNWNPSDGIEYDSENDEYQPTMPPPNSRRPGPDSGDAYDQDVADTQLRRPPHRTLTSNKQNTTRQGVGPLPAPFHRRHQTSPLPTTLEHSPTRSYDDPYRGTQQARDFENHANLPYRQYPNDRDSEYPVPGGAFDRDGYPIASSAYGWDKQADLLPPGGMDSLLRNRTGEVPTSTHHYRSSTRPQIQAVPSGEIQFQPPQNVSPQPPNPKDTRRPQAQMVPNEDIHFQSPLSRSQHHSQHPQMAMETAPPVPGYDRMVSSQHSHQRAAHVQHLVQNAPTPMAGEDYVDDDIYGGRMSTLARTQTSGPGFGSRLGVNNSSATATLTNLERSKTAGPGLQSSSGSSATSNHSNFNGPANKRKMEPHGASVRPTGHLDNLNADQVSSGAPHESKYSSGSGSQPSLAPPLVKKDLRGRPDDTSIYDPSNIMNGVNFPAAPNDNYQASGGNMDAHQVERDELNSSTRKSSLADKSSSGGSSNRKEPPPVFSQPMSSRKMSPYRFHQEYDEEDRSVPRYGAFSSFNDDDAIQKTLASLSVQQSQSPPTASSPDIVDSMSERPSQYVETGSKSAEYGQSASAVGAIAPSPERVTAMIRKLSMSQNGVPQTDTATPHEIPVVLHCLNMPEMSSNIRQQALKTLASITRSEGNARQSLIQHNGIETVVKTMWDDISNSQVQDAATDFLLAVASSSDAQPSNDLLSDEEAFCDALLFSMQMHGHVANIQLKGCCIFACLAEASSNNPKISDGTLSGATMMVLTAMSQHQQKPEIQKAGLQALYYQCTFSSNSESNKRSLVESQLDNGTSGISVIVNAMDCLHDDYIAIAWACRLFWILSSSEDLVKAMSGMPQVIQVVLQTCRHNLADPAGAPVVEACFGFVGNLAHVEANHVELHEAAAIDTIVQGFSRHTNDYEVCVEAATALANLTMFPPGSDALLRANGLDTLFQAIHTFIDHSEFVTEAMRTIVGVTINTVESKEILATPDIVGFVVTLSSKYQDVTLIQEMCCTLLASLAVGHKASDVIVDNDGLDLIARVLKNSPEERVIEAACTVYRNLCCQLKDTDCIMKKGVVKALVNAMLTYERNVSIQLNACCCIWNLASKTEKEPGMVVDGLGVKAIVKAMQNHMESGELLEEACGALWSLVDDSIDRKKDFVGNGAIDAVVCTLVMHPTTTSTLIKALGVFSSVSLEGPLAEAIANAQGVNVVVDAMRNNGKAIPLLEMGCLILRNIVFRLPDHAQEASMVVSTVIDALQENTTEVGFQEEACSLLWVLAAEEEGCKSKILALDGISVLMKCLEHSSDNPSVQEAALGAFNQLATAG